MLQLVIFFFIFTLNVALYCWKEEMNNPQIYILISDQVSRGLVHEWAQKYCSIRPIFCKGKVLEMNCQVFENVP